MLLERFPLLLCVCMCVCVPLGLRVGRILILEVVTVAVITVNETHLPRKI